MALDALFVHDVLLLQLALRFHGLNGPGFLGEYIVAGIAIAKAFLMLKVRKGYFPARSAEEVHLFSARVAAIRHGEWQQQAGTQNKDKGHFQFHLAFRFLCDAI
jgi:hypothetical protein